MYWTTEHDVLLCQEVICENPYKTKKGSTQRSEIWERIAKTLNSCSKPVFAVDKRSVRDHVGILVNRLKKKLRAEERSSGIAPPEPSELETLIEEIIALEETADVETKDEDENLRGKTEREKAKASDMRLKALEKVSETMKRHANNGADQEKVRKRERRSGSETMLFLTAKAEKDHELKLEELNLKKEQQAIENKRLQVSVDQQRQFQQQQSEMMQLMQEQQQQQQKQLLASQQLMLKQQQDHTKALMSLLDKLVNK